MKHLLLLVSMAAMLGLAAPAHADNTGNDSGFLAALDQQGISHRGASQAIAAGRAVCELMDGGLSHCHVVSPTSLDGLVEEGGEPPGGGVEVEGGSGAPVEGVLDAFEVGFGVIA